MRKIIYLVLAALALSSCEKVIDVDLNEAEKKYVIEANLSDQAGSALVLLTQTRNFDESNDFPGVSGAVVTISEAGGASYTLTESAPGGKGHQDCRGS